MKKKEIILLTGTIILALGAVATVIGLRRFSGTGSKAQQENRPRNIRLEEVTPTSATISWTTKEPSQGFVSYGETMSLGKTVQTGEKATVHNATLPNLSAGTTYYYKVGVGEEIFDNEGVPYSFTTPKKPAPEDDAESQKDEPTESSFAEESAPVEPTKTEEDFRKAIGTDSPEYDLNGDGVVNSLDIMLFRKQK